MHDLTSTKLGESAGEGDLAESVGRHASFGNGEMERGPLFCSPQRHYGILVE